MVQGGFPGIGRATDPGYRKVGYRKVGCSKVIIPRPQEPDLRS